MKYKFILLLFSLNISCQNFGKLKVITDLPSDLKEVSGLEIVESSKRFWMLNDSGNKPRVFAVSKKGNIKKEISVKSKNHDWEDLASDEKGNLYIGDFGNNYNTRDDLRILKLDKKYLKKDKKGKVKKIHFTYEDQTEFPPKKKDRHFDAEAFIYFKDHFYIFTKSRVPGNHGLTNLYRISASEGRHVAKKIGQYHNGTDNPSWITSADISEDGKKLVLLSQKNVIVFTDFTGDEFFKGKKKIIPFSHRSQKESIAFKDSNTVVIADEKSGKKLGLLYELSLNH